MLPVKSTSNISSSSNSEKIDHSTNAEARSTSQSKVAGLTLTSSSTQDPASNPNNLPVSPRPSLSQRAVPLSPRLLKTKNSVRDNRVHRNSTEIKLIQDTSSSLMMSKSEKKESVGEEPPPYSAIDPYPRALPVPKLNLSPTSVAADDDCPQSSYSSIADGPQPSTPTKLSGDVIQNKDKTASADGMKFSEPVVSPRKKNMVRHTAMQRSSTIITDKSDKSQAMTPRSTGQSAIGNMYSFLAKEVTKSIIGNKSATADSVKTLGRIDAKIDIDALPVELRSFFKKYTDKKISLSGFIRDTFSEEFKSGSAWKKAEKYLHNLNLLEDPDVKIGEVDKVVKEEKLMILKPLAESVALNLMGAKGQIAEGALPDQFVRHILMPVDEKILEWALASPSIDVKTIQEARFFSFYNLVALRFYMPLISDEFGKNPSQMNLWMCELIKDALFEVCKNIFSDYLSKFNENIPDRLILKLDIKSKSELQDKRIAEFQNKKVSRIDSPQSKAKEINWQENKIKKSNAVFLNKIKNECGIAGIEGAFSDFLQADMEKWFLFDEKAERGTVLLNLSFAIESYLSSNPVEQAETIAAIQKASETLSKLINTEILGEARSRASVLIHDLKETVNPDKHNASASNQITTNSVGSGSLSSPGRQSAPATISTLTAPTNIRTTDALNGPTRLNQASDSATTNDDANPGETKN